MGTEGSDTSSHVFGRNRYELALDACQALQAYCHVRNEVLDFSVHRPSSMKRTCWVGEKETQCADQARKMEVWLGGKAASGPVCGVIMPVYYATDRMSTEVPEGCNSLIGNIP